MILYLAQDIINPENGEFIYLRGEELSENVILDLMSYGITVYEVSPDMEIPTLPLQSKDGWESLSDTDDDDDEDLGLELNTLNSMFYYLSEPDLTEFLIN